MAQRTVIFNTADSKLKYKVGTQLFDIPVGGEIPLADNLTISLEGKFLKLKDGELEYFFIDKGVTQSAFLGDGTANGKTGIFCDFISKQTKIGDWNGNGNLTLMLFDDDTNTITVYAKVVNTKIVAKNFPNDIAAEAGGIEIGEDYHDNGIKRVRIA